MKIESLQNSARNIDRRRFIWSSAGALFFTRALMAEGTSAAGQIGDDPLPSWKDGPAKAAILTFVHDTTDKSSSKFVQPANRIATFDQDGTLWTEHPMYGQAAFALARIGQMASGHPEWKEKEPFKTVIARDYASMARFSEADWLQIVAVTHAGMSTETFHQLVREWLATAKDPRFHRPYTDLVYQPMLEVMQYLRANDFLTYIVSGGGQEFIRAYSERVYGIPPQQIVGSSTTTTFVDTGIKPEIMRDPKPFFIDDGPGKPLGINLFIGKRPLAAFGNSATTDFKSGDAQMLEWTQAGDGARLMMLVLHDDAKREYAYGPANGLPDTGVGTFSQALMDKAKKNSWTVISMKNDWNRIFPFES